MTNQEMVDKIVSKSGITREQAEKALELNNGDLLDAMIYVERTYSTYAGSAQAHSQQQQPHFEQNDYSGGAQYSQFNVDEQKFEHKKSGAVGALFKKLLNVSVSNGITIYYKESEIVTIPLLVWIILFFSSVSTLAAIMFITMFFDVRYSFSGKELGKDKVNRVMADIYDFVQSLKVRVFN